MKTHTRIARTTALFAALLALAIAPAADAATIGYWQFDDAPNGNNATTLASQFNNADLAATASGNGGGPAPQHSSIVPDIIIRDGVGGPKVNAVNSTSLRFFNTGGINSTIGSVVTVQDAVSNDSLLEPAGDFTIEGFVRINSHVNFATLFGKARSPGNNTSFTIDTNGNGTLRVRVDSTDVIEPNPNQSGQTGDGVFNQGQTTSFNLLDGQWHHIALTYTGSTRTVALFGDYVFQASMQLADSGIVQWDDFPLYFGDLAGGRALDGWLDEIRYSTGVLTTSQFLVAVAPAPAALPAGLALLGFAAFRRRCRR